MFNSLRTWFLSFINRFRRPLANVPAGGGPELSINVVRSRPARRVRPHRYARSVNRPVWI